MPLSTNKRLGRYEIRSQIGAGGMGDVYLATDSLLGRDVALKVPIRKKPCLTLRMRGECRRA